MDTNEAIEWIDDIFVIADINCEIKKRNQVFDLLTQGEKYKHLWKSIESAKINDKTIQKAIRILIKGIEEGYKNKPLPKEDPNLIQYQNRKDY